MGMQNEAGSGGVSYSLGRLLTVCALFIIAACGNDSALEASLAGIGFHIEEDEKKRNIKRSVEVVLSERVSAVQLKKIAHSLKDSDPNSYNLTFIGYFIEGVDRDDGYWATSHFTPELNVIIAGLTKEQETLLAKPDYTIDSTNIIGTWVDARPYVHQKIILHSQDGALTERLYDIYGKPPKITEMVSRKVNGLLRFDDKEPNSFGEFFILNQAGKLERWSENGRYYTAEIFP